MFTLERSITECCTRKQLPFAIRIIIHDRDTLCGQNAEILNVKSGCVYTTLCVLKGKSTETC
jgi:hypothetical protein